MKESAPMRRGKGSVATVALLGLILALAATPFLEGDELKKATKTFPKHVLIIRHAEKPPDKDKSVHLSKPGKNRAKALPALFESSPKRPDPFPRPDFIFATHNSKNSHRPVETVTPLANKLGLPINDTFRNHFGNEKKPQVKDKGKGIIDLSKELLGHKRYQGKTVLVCWHHGTIPDLAKWLQVTGHPKKWDGKVFDRVWQITYDKEGQATFIDRPQRLLPGDSKK